jgi:hypothetical protein
MTDYSERNDRAVLTNVELNAMQSMLNSGDRAGFYLTYYSMTDSAEALLQSKIATFSGMAGGAAFAANRFLQDQYGANYPGIYYLSQQVAQFGLDAIKASVQNDGSGKIDERRFSVQLRMLGRTMGFRIFFLEICMA